tara:strand:+ start:76 stop:582 length:507 start_codon:yes stop_codon:yes gene_type:complete
VNEQCRVPSCENLIRIKKLRLCNKHYLRWERYGRLRASRREKGAGTRTTHGYSSTCINGLLKYDHIRIMEKKIGRNLTKLEIVHHIDGDRANNSLENLLLCPDTAFHLAIHRRERALKGCGNENYRKCGKCTKWDDPKYMYEYNSNCKDGKRYLHPQQYFKCVRLAAK